MIQGDLNNKESLDSVLNYIDENFENISVFVNTITPKILEKNFLETEWSYYEEHLNLNIKSSFQILKILLPKMIKNNYGKIVHISTQAIEHPVNNWSHFITAKSVLNGFIKSIAVDIAPKGIRMNLVSPGMTETELISHIP